MVGLKANTRCCNFTSAKGKLARMSSSDDDYDEDSQTSQERESMYRPESPDDQNGMGKQAGNESKMKRMKMH